MTHNSIYFAPLSVAPLSTRHRTRKARKYPIKMRIPLHQYVTLGFSQELDEHVHAVLIWNQAG
jgi:hypothetical protein